MQNLPRYISHKEVEALQIAAIQPVMLPRFTGLVCRGSLALGTGCGKCERCAWERTNPPEIGAAMIVPVEPDYAPFMVSKDYVSKHLPRVGGFWVRYADGYESWSPHDAFTQGYTLIVNPPPPAPRFMKVYGCGCTAGPGPSNMPDYCSEHGNPEDTSECRTVEIPNVPAPQAPLSDAEPAQAAD